METKKMMKTAGVLNKLFKILQRLIVVGMTVAIIVTSVLTVVNMVNPDAVIGEGFANVELGPLELTVDNEFAPDNAGILTFCWIVLALGSTNAVAIWFCLKYLRNILEPMQNSNPFHKNTAGNFKKLAWIVLAMGIISNIVEAIAVQVAVKQWHLMELVQADGIQKISVQMDGDLYFILIFFGLLLLSYIFHYGASLQQLSDETL